MIFKQAAIQINYDTHRLTLHNPPHLDHHYQRDQRKEKRRKELKNKKYSLDGLCSQLSVLPI